MASSSQPAALKRCFIRPTSPIPPPSPPCTRPSAPRRERGHSRQQRGRQRFQGPLENERRRLARFMAINLERRLELRARVLAGNDRRRPRRDHQYRLSPRLRHHTWLLSLPRHQTRHHRADAVTGHRVCGERRSGERDRARLYRDADRLRISGTRFPIRRRKGAAPATSIRQSGSAGPKKSRGPRFSSPQTRRRLSTPRQS